MKNALRLAGAVLVFAGVAALGAALAGYAEGPAWQSVHKAARTGASLVARPAPLLQPGEPFARLRIPKIGLDLMVIEGTRSRDLRRAPGHLIGSAMPGSARNCVIAGHRDTHFHRLGDLTPGDIVELGTGERSMEYRVETARVVSPSEGMNFLEPGTQPVLTLVTCYPFRYVGPAPRRYVVRARLDNTYRAML